MFQATVPDLVEGQEYEFRVIAKNTAGQSEPSEPSDMVTAKARYRKLNNVTKPRILPMS